MSLLPRFLSRNTSISLTMLMLTGCAQAISQTPNITAAELAQEQAAQKAIVQNEVKRSSSATENHNRAQMLQRLKRLGSKITLAGKKVCAQILEKNQACEYPFALDKDSATAVNAYTDGKNIVVSPAMMKFAYDDNQLATVLAHEFAHAIMTHPQKTQQNATIGSLLGVAVDALAQSQGINTGGALSKLGAQGAVMRYSQGFEKEADYIGMYILDRAGYNIHSAAHLWRRMATLNPDGIYTGSTHPTTAERYILLDKTSQEITRKKSTNAPLIPEWKPEDENSGFLGGLL